MRKCWSYGLMLVVLLGSVGLPLYKHTCLHDNVTISTLFVASDHCSPEHEKEELEHQEESGGKGCCAPAPEQDVATDGCCSESMAMLSVSFNFFQHFELSPFISPEISPEAGFYLKFIPAAEEKKQILYGANSDPPKPGGKQLLKEQCIWRI